MSRSAVRLLRHHVRVELGRPADGLAGVVDDEVEALARGDQVAAERLHARRVAQVETEDLEPMAPVAEVGFLRVARRGVARKPGRHDEVRAGAQELQAGLVADLHAPAGQQRDASAQIRQLGARGEVDVGAGGAELIVEGVDVGVRLLADVADAIHEGTATFVVRGSSFGVRRSSFGVRRSSFGAVSRSTSVDSNGAGGNTFGVVTTGRRRSARIPVVSRRPSSRRTFSALAALLRLRPARRSGTERPATARWSRRRSAAGSSSSSRQSAAASSSSSMAPRIRSTKGRSAAAVGDGRSSVSIARQRSRNGTPREGFRRLQTPASRSRWSTHTAPRRRTR